MNCWIDSLDSVAAYLMSLCGNHTSTVSKLWVPGCEMGDETGIKDRILFSIYTTQMNV